jgi:folate-binding protein YgfZ
MGASRAGVTVVGVSSGAEAIRAGAAVVPAVPRAFFLVTGERPLGFLHDVVTQDVADLSPGRGAIAAVLTDKGRVVAEVRVSPVLGGALLDAEPDAAPGIRDGIGMHAPLAGCELEEPPGYVLAAVRGPEATAAMEAAGIPVPGEGEAASARAGNVFVVRVAWGVPGFDLIGPREDVAALVTRLGIGHATFEELEAARIEAGRPRYGVDVTDDLLINETPLLDRAVSFTKGCYPGQESVARVRNLGGVRRLLRGVRADAGVLSPGLDLRQDGPLVGEVTSAASTPDGRAAGIALMRSEVTPGSEVEAGDARVTVTALP